MFPFNSLTKSGPLSHLLLSEPFLPQPLGGAGSTKVSTWGPLAPIVNALSCMPIPADSPTLSGCRYSLSMAQTSWAVALMVGGVIDQELPVDSKNGW
jgi:hypothetical protein